MSRRSALCGGGKSFAGPVQAVAPGAAGALLMRPGATVCTDEGHAVTFSLDFFVVTVSSSMFDSSRSWATSAAAMAFRVALLN